MYSSGQVSVAGAQRDGRKPNKRTLIGRLSGAAGRRLFVHRIAPTLFERLAAARLPFVLLWWLAETNKSIIDYCSTPNAKTIKILPSSQQTRLVRIRLQRLAFAARNSDYGSSRRPYLFCSYLLPCLLQLWPASSPASSPIAVDSRRRRTESLLVWSAEQSLTLCMYCTVRTVCM